MFVALIAAYTLRFERVAELVPLYLKKGRHMPQLSLVTALYCRVMKFLKKIGNRSFKVSASAYLTSSSAAKKAWAHEMKVNVTTHYRVTSTTCIDTTDGYFPVFTLKHED